MSSICLTVSLFCALYWWGGGCYIELFLSICSGKGAAAVGGSPNKSSGCVCRQQVKYGKHAQTISHQRTHTYTRSLVRLYTTFKKQTKKKQLQCYELKNLLFMISSPVIVLLVGLFHRWCYLIILCCCCWIIFTQYYVILPASKWRHLCGNKILLVPTLSCVYYSSRYSM